MHIKFKLLSVFFLFLLLLRCNDKENKTAEHTQANVVRSFLFDILGPEATNIHFQNSVRENLKNNSLTNDYLYNGAGVSVADFNRDNLPDIYFLSNQENNQLYLNRGGLKFENITDISGTKGNNGFHTGSTIVDINADGLLDIYVCKSGSFEDSNHRKNELYVNQGNNKEGIPLFKEEASKFKLDLSHYSTQAAFFDYDRDGDLDMFLINHNMDTRVLYELEKKQKIASPLTSDRLYRNDNNHFIDASDQAGLINDGISFGLGLAIGDLNNDGWPDVVVGQDFGSKDRMYLNKGDGTFNEIMNEVTGHISYTSMGNDMADFNNDGWLDFISVDMIAEENYGQKASMTGMNDLVFNMTRSLGLHHQYMVNSLQMNAGNIYPNNVPYFSDVASLAGITNTDWSWGPLLFDMDNDGDKDLFISNGIKGDYTNIDYIHFKQREEQAYNEKLKNTPANMMEILQLQHVSKMLEKMPSRRGNNYLFENNGDGSFLKRNESWAKEILTCSNGAAYADLDNDGDIDIVTNNMDTSVMIYRNNSADRKLGNFLKIKLDGPGLNPDGVGSRIEITTENGKQMLEQYFSRGFQSSGDRVLHFGLGKELMVQKLTIFWPDGKKQILNEIDANQTLVLNYSSSNFVKNRIASKHQLFRDLSNERQLRHHCIENPYDDFQREPLLPYKMSKEGPALAITDLNQDGLDDFFIGGSKGYPGSIYIQQPNGSFDPIKNTEFTADANFEDVAARFIDVENDGDLDLYVVSGGNEHEPFSDYYNDRLYLNINGQFIRAQNVLPSKSISGSVICSNDIDSDGDLDLFIGGRQIPGQYPLPPSSYLLKNESQDDQVKFELHQCNILNEIGMVTDAMWVDIDHESDKELIIVGEWMSPRILKYVKNDLQDITQDAGLDLETGWWYSINAADFDKDGDMDLVAGNLGLNSKYKASQDEPFHVYAGDFDNSGSWEAILGYHQNRSIFPVRGRTSISAQLSFIERKFPDYHSFANADLAQIFGQQSLDAVRHLKAANFSSCYFENLGNGKFEVNSLPQMAQITTTRDIIIEDVNVDGNLDLILLGNRYGFEVKTPRQDAGYGMCLIGDGEGSFHAMMPYESGLYVHGEVAHANILEIPGDTKGLLIARNNDYLKILELEQ